MDRRNFVKSSLATASGALLAGHRLSAAQISQAPEKVPDDIPGAIPASAIDAARFPDNFLWGMASAA
jgi:beta-glucosidase